MDNQLDYYIGDTIEVDGVDCEIVGLHPEIGLHLRANQLIEVKIKRLRILADTFWYCLQGEAILADRTGERFNGKGGRPSRGPIIGISCAEQKKEKR